MKTLEKTKMLALEIVNLIDNGDLKNFETYGKIGDKIERLADLRLEIIKLLVPKKGNKYDNNI